MTETFFTSDTHYYHKNIIKYCKRPFQDVAEMNQVMVDRWNSRVNENDTVFHLGDFGFVHKGEGSNILQMLKGKKILILGSHDRKASYMSEMGFDEVYTQFDWKGWLLHHVPIKVKQPLLCGHVHEKWCRLGKFIINVGVDQWNFTPQTIDELIKAPEESFEIHCPNCNAIIRRMEDNREHWSGRCLHALNEQLTKDDM